MTNTTTDAAEARATALAECAAIAERWRDENKASAAKARKSARVRGDNGMADQLEGAAIECNAIAQEIRRLATAEAASGAGEREGRFWLIVREPGKVPERKGSWPHREVAHRLREFIAARPHAFIDVLTIGHDGVPEVEHGPEVLQYTDGRSMSVGRKHNQRVRAAAEEALASLPPATDPAMVRKPKTAAELKAVIEDWLAADCDWGDWEKALAALVEEPALTAAPTIPATGEADDDCPCGIGDQSDIGHFHESWCPATGHAATEGEG